MSREILKWCGLSEVATPLWTMAEDIQGYAAAGFGAIGLFIHKFEKPQFVGFWIPGETISGDKVGAAADAIKKAGLKVSHMAVVGFYTEPDREARIAHTLHAMDIAAALDCEALIVAPGRRNGRSYEETRDYAARALTEVFERHPEGTRQSQVRLALEPIIPWQSDYLNTLGEALELADLVDHPDIGVYVDSFHLWRTGTLLEDIGRAGPRIFGVHLNDAVEEDTHHNRLAGEGELPLRDIVRAVEATGYRGTYDCEYMYDPSLIESDPERFAPEVVVQRCAQAVVDVLDGVIDVSRRQSAAAK
jgi:sugar phosphate isomerase/epimerase